jgi:hypothetical protein
LEEELSDSEHVAAATITPTGPSVSIRRRDDEPVSIPHFEPVFGTTPEEAAREEAWNRFVELGTPVELTQDNLPRNRLPTQIAERLPAGGFYTLRLGQHPKGSFPMALTFRSLTGDEYLVPYVDLRTERGGSREVVITNDHQAIPFKIRMVLSTDLSAHEVWRFDLAGKAVRWLDDVRRFARAAQPGASATLCDLNTGKVHRSVITNSVTDSNLIEALGDFVDRLIRIQELTNAELLIPRRPYPSERDMEAMMVIETFLEHPERIGISQFHGSFGSELRPLISSLLTVSPWATEIPHTVPLLDCDVHLGTLRVECDAATIHPDDTEAAIDFVAGASQRVVQLRIVPSSESVFRATLIREPSRVD